VMAYDLASKRISRAVEGNDNGIEGIAVDAGVLYFTRVWRGQDRVALYSHILATGVEQLISNLGQDPVAADGKLLWAQKVQLPCSPTYPDPETGEYGQRC